MAKRANTTRPVLMAVLGTAGPLSGYEIRSFLQVSVAQFWSESFGQIYPQLRSMARAGLIEEVAGDGKRDKRRFRLTPAGQKALSEWMSTPPPPERPRSELLLKLFFAGFAPPGAARAILAGALAGYRAARERAEAGQLRIMAEDATDPNLAYYLIVTDAGRLILDARIKWAERALALLDAAEQGGNAAVLEHMRKLRTWGTDTCDPS